MTIAADSMPNGAVPDSARSEPPLWSVVLIFWCAFLVPVVASGILDPHLFESQDPDNFLRLVQVRDLLAGQGWFDLVQHRMDPPGGALMHWSRLIDAPIAALILLGDLFGAGERFALTAWPALLFLGLMGSAAAIASALAGRSAAVWTLVLSLFFINPLMLYLPGDIDHHNAQVALMMATLALVLRFGSGARFGFFAGCTSALTLAIGLEMLPHVVLIGAIVALRWAIGGSNGRAVAAYAATLAILPAALYLAAGSPAAAMACDSLSWAYAVPAAIAGLGLAGLAHLGGERGRRPVRLAGLAAIGMVAVGFFVIVTPQCLTGPYGSLSPELKEIWLSTVTEARAFPAFAAREPVGAFGSLMPLLVAMAVALGHLRSGSSEKRGLWLLPATLIVMATALSFYQVRTLPFASAVAIPVLGVWLAGLRAQNLAGAKHPLRRAWPVAAGFLVAIPVTYLIVGLRAVDIVSYVSDGRIAPTETAKPPAELVQGLTAAEKECFDPASGALLASAPKGLVLAPLFYGPTVLMLSPHDVVAGPYHRNGQSILDAIHAMHRAPAEAQAIVERRGVDYIAICSVSIGAALAKEEAPDGFLAGLLAGNVSPWLAEVAAPEKTGLRLWRVLR